MSSLAELKEFVKSQVRVNTSELDTLLASQINMAYRRFARMALWPGLRVDDETLTGIGSTRYYTAPYPIERLIQSSFRYDVTATSPGQIVSLSENAQFYRASAASTITPQIVSLTSGTGADLYKTGTIAISNRGIALVGTGTTFTSAMVGEWIVLHGTTAVPVGGGDYGYKIGAFGSATALTLATPYRGPDLTASSFSIRPGNQQRLVFDPLFTETAKAMIYAYQRKPARLYNDEDALEVDSLGDAVCWQAIAWAHGFHSDLKAAAIAQQSARNDFIRAKALLL